MHSPQPLILPRILPGGSLVGLGEETVARAAFTRDWGGIHAAQVHLDGGETPRGALVNNLISMNLGAEAVCEANIEGRGWETFRTPHHGVWVLPASLEHAARSRVGGDYLLVEVVPDFVAGILGGPQGAGALPLVLGARDSFAEHVLLALADQGRWGAPSSALAESLGTALVNHFAERRAIPEQPAAPHSLPSPTLDIVLEYIARHLDVSLSLERLASVAGMDLFRFARAFKQSTGSSPHRYLLEARIALAKELLRDQSRSITEVALQAGFATPSHFSVTFRRITGVTPRAYRDGLR
jgi:AraC family transcriptional regulator